jgi:hypothetical protein
MKNRREDKDCDGTGGTVLEMRVKVTNDEVNSEVSSEAEEDVKAVGELGFMRGRDGCRICVSVSDAVFSFLKSQLSFMGRVMAAFLEKGVGVQRAKGGAASKPRRDSQVPVHCTTLRIRRRC